MIELIIILVMTLLFVLVGSVDNIGNSEYIDIAPDSLVKKPKKTVTFSDSRTERIFDVKTRKILIPEIISAT